MLYYSQFNRTIHTNHTQKHTMKDIFVLPKASSIYKELERTRKSGNLNSNELECLLFKALFLLEETEAENNRHQSNLKFGQNEPFWQGQQ